MQSVIDPGKKYALQQLNDLERALISAVRQVISALEGDGRIDLGEGIAIGSAGLMMGMQVAGLLKSLSAQGASDLLFALENSERVYIEGG